jgi:hypothetical protein
MFCIKELTLKAKANSDTKTSKTITLDEVISNLSCEK